MIPLTIEESQSYHEKSCYICKDFNIDNKDEKYQKVRDHCHYTRKIEGLPMKFAI